LEDNQWIMKSTAHNGSCRRALTAFVLGIVLGISFHAMFSFHLECNFGRTGLDVISSITGGPVTATGPFQVAPIDENYERFKSVGVAATGEEIIVKNEDRPLVVIATCTRSKGDWKSIQDTSFQQLLIPSLHRTISVEEITSRFRIEILTVFDQGDSFWENSVNRQALQSLTMIPINFLSISKDPSRSRGRIPMNEMCLAAYEYQADYLIRINDDTEFIKFSNWISYGIETLRDKFIPSNVGVVGPQCLQGNTAILTHDMVHLPTHMTIFHGNYYPDEFDNWYLDDWITHVYGAHRTSRLSKGWEVHHHIDKHGTRYAPNTTFASILQPTIRRDRVYVEKYLSSIKQQEDLKQSGKLVNITRYSYDSNVTTKAILGTDRVGIADGPIAELHEIILKKRKEGK